MSTDQDTDGRSLHARLALVDGVPVLHAYLMTPEETAAANNTLRADEAEWAEVGPVRDEQFDAFYVAALTPLAVDALGRVIGGEAERVTTVDALEARYLPLFRAMLHRALEVGQRVHANLGE